MITKIEAKNITIVEFLKEIKMYRIYFDDFYLDTPTFISIVGITEFAMLIKISLNEYFLFKTGNFIQFTSEKMPPFYYRFFNSEEITDFKPVKKPVSSGIYKLLFPYYLMLSANNIYLIVDSETNSEFIIMPLHKFNNTKTFLKLEEIIPSKSNYGAYKAWKYFEKKKKIETTVIISEFLVNKDTSYLKKGIPWNLRDFDFYYSTFYDKYKITENFNKIRYLKMN